MTLKRNDEDILWCQTMAELPCFEEFGIQYGFEGINYVENRNLITPQQIHSDNISQINGSETILKPCDGLWTYNADLKIAVKTADCLPILLLEPEARMIMVLHAGWRGLCGGILNRGFEIFQAQGLLSGSLRMILGPCIRRDVFEVGPEVVREFRGSYLGLTNLQLDLAIRSGSKDRSFMDLSLLAGLIALNFELRAENIYGLRSCTKSNPLLWNSYRREGRVIGSNYSWMSLR